MEIFPRQQPCQNPEVLLPEPHVSKVDAMNDYYERKQQENREMWGYIGVMAAVTVGLIIASLVIGWMLTHWE